MPFRSRRLKGTFSRLSFRLTTDEKKTKEALDEEGWFHTGDIAEVDPAGRFKIIDRLKVRRHLCNKLPR